MQRDFQNKTVVITGACRGIGAGIAERFARDGANLVMVSNAERVHETAETLRQRYQADILSLQVDVTDEAQVQGLYEQAAARFGTIDVSIQNAGVITIDYYDRMPKADFEKVLAVNTTGVWLCCREAAKYMVKQNHGSLINTSSGQGRQGFIYTPHYAASKMGVIGITKAWRTSWHRGISPSTPSAPASLRARCGITTTACGAKFSAPSRSATARAN